MIQRINRAWKIPAELLIAAPYHLEEDGQIDAAAGQTVYLPDQAP